MSCIDSPLDCLLELLSPTSLLTDMMTELMTSTPDISAVYPLWQAVVYSLSAFYGLVVLWAGFCFVTSGGDVVKRDRAKTRLRDSVLLVVFVQSSYVLYNLLVDIAYSLVFTVDSSYFSWGVFDFILLVPYIMALVTTLVYFGLIRLFVSVGVALFPIGLMLYFTPLRSYGKMVMSVLVVTMFLPFLSSLVLMGAWHLDVMPLIGLVAVDVMIFMIVGFAVLKAAGSVMGLVRRAKP